MKLCSAGRAVRLYRYRNTTGLQYEAVFGRKGSKTLSISKYDRATIRNSVRQEGQYNFIDIEIRPGYSAKLCSAGRAVRLYRYRNTTGLQYETVFGRKGSTNLSISKHDRATVRPRV